MTEDWDDKHGLLSATRPLYHNEDYWRFLVRDVWRIAEGSRRVVDFGRGFGWAGQFLMPMLAAGGDYTGLDRSRALIDRGRAMFAERPHDRRFVLGEATSAPFDDQFDVASACRFRPSTRRTRSACSRRSATMGSPSLQWTTNASSGPFRR